MRGRFFLLSCLFVSGFSGLAYEILWTRAFGLVFGTMAVSVSAVLAAFFLGLAAGSHLAGRWAHRLRRPLLAYAVLETAIGVFGAGSYFVIGSLDQLEVALGASEPGTLLAVRFAAALVVLFVPTCAMGATLPVLLHGLVERRGEVGRLTAQVYGINTLGAVGGAYASSYWLLPRLGAAGALWLTVALNFAVALVVWIGFRRRLSTAEAGAPPDAGGEGRGGDRRRELAHLPLALAALAGLVSIALEVVLTRLLSTVLEGTIYSFGAVLATFLAGIGLGSVLIAPRLGRPVGREGFALYARLLLTVFASVAVPLLLLPWAQYALLRLESGFATGVAQIHAKLLVSVLVLLPLATAFGAAFPLLVALYRSARSAAAGLGRIYAANTVGAIVGSAAAGLVLVPTLGTDGTLLLILALVAAQAAVAGVAGGARALAWGGLALWAGFVLAWPGTPVAALMRSHTELDLDAYRRHLESAEDHLLYMAQGRTGDIAVFSSEQSWALFINGLPQAGGFPEPPPYGAESVILALLPYALHRSPASALVVGYGGGITTDVLVHTEEVERVRVVEIEPRVLEAVEAVHRGPPFGDGRAPHQHPRVEVRLSDARNLLLRDPERFDLILCHVTDPWLSGAAGLATREFFALARDRLVPGGVFMIWLGGWGQEHARSVSLALSEVFADLLVATVDYATYLLASDQPMVLAPTRMAERIGEPGLASFVAPMGLDRVEKLLTLIIGAGRAVPGPVPANTDDNAYVEVALPLLRRRGQPALVDLPVAVLSEPALTPGRFAAGGEERILELAEAELMTPGGTLPPSAGLSRLARLKRPHRAAALVAANRETLPGDAGSYLQGRLALARGDYESAMAALSSVRPGDRVFRRSRRFLAAARLLQGDNESALAVARELSVAGDPDGAYLYGLLAAESDPAGARAALELARPHRPEAAVPLARQARGLRPLAPFRDDLERAVATDPGNHQAHDLLADVAREVGDESRERRHRSLAVDAARREAARLAEVAAIHAGAGRPGAAAAALRRALALDPTPAELWLRLLARLLEAGDVEGAEGAVTEGLRLTADPRRLVEGWGRLRPSPGRSADDRG